MPAEMILRQPRVWLEGARLIHRGGQKETVDTKVTSSQRLDHLDAQRLREMLESVPFGILRDRMKVLLERAQGDCERHDDPRDIHRAQGYVKALKAVLALPDQILREISKPK